MLFLFDLCNVGEYVADARRPTYPEHETPEQEELVRPVKTSPLPLHEHDLLYAGDFPAPDSPGKWSQRRNKHIWKAMIN